ncbi:hypothetical protein GCM10010329_06650 [Streptomyces spiroverticillatus]|uniref:Guanylate cyclase domain-containing protein n=1 Tax=Streptomyces finlayi TaxID=67296 RepID=A0A919C782_9ACTN|nr:hypothetical protein [Streptomyces finlayi]GGZ89005.1 hypothetical protein GCM10010329_06650 [Streptomyces spiroverticillatus]GHC79933.1 hypothetical protein GCM10010334_06630 [Streptomyces finlayi]
MTDPVSRTFLLLDIEKFSDRDDVEQAYLRRMLYGLTDRVLECAGIDETLRRRADRGDSVMELIDANAPLTALLRALIHEAPAQLRSMNRMASRSAQMRLRVVVATGYVWVDEHEGWVGADLNHACRLLDAGLLRSALAQRRDDVALCVSDSVHAGIVRHDHQGIPAEDFHAITVDSKNGPLQAWLLGPLPADAPRAGDQDHCGTGDLPVPGHQGEPGTGRRDGRNGGPAVPGAAPHFAGGYVGGDNHGVSAGSVGGDIRFDAGRRAPGGAS